MEHVPDGCLGRRGYLSSLVVETILRGRQAQFRAKWSTTVAEPCIGQTGCIKYNEYGVGWEAAQGLFEGRGHVEPVHTVVPRTNCLHQMRLYCSMKTRRSARVILD